MTFHLALQFHCFACVNNQCNIVDCEKYIFDYSNNQIYIFDLHPKILGLNSQNPWYLSKSNKSISGFSAFSKSSLNIWKFSFFIVLKPGLENFEHYFASMWDECNCVVVWAFFGIAFLTGWDENWPFPVLRPLLSFQNLLANWVHHFHSIHLRTGNTSAEFHQLH